MPGHRCEVIQNPFQKLSANEALSLVVHCQTYEEVDYDWKKLTEDGGEEVECGWRKDKFELSWQIVPDIFLELLRNSDE